jgi:hypothetical protein
MAFGSYYSGGGQNADYRADLNFGGGGSGGAGGGGNLNAQMQAMSNFDPTALLNKMLEYGAAQQRYAANRGDWEYGRAKKAGQDATRMASMQMAAPARKPTAPYGGSKMRELLSKKQALDSTQDPWSGRGYGQSVGQQFFNLPAAAALTYGQDIFPNGFDTSAKLMAGAGGVNPAVRGPATDPWSLGTGGARY